ncbi:hypothetical protein F511_09421 [Dorcoceras hygrometricum]|uniref:Uncharacterized protein n=1 Tax=Dorcoceras hygrometricum TaxID=472368 RepID=A0A2Z7AKJ6_9LAMI|nr:hypothetical protein F511_09421 [Dorcoceras hygrometricum]
MICTLVWSLESTNLEESSDDEAHNRHPAGDQQAMDMQITNADIQDVGQAGPDHDQCCDPTTSCIPEPLRVTQVLVSQFPYGYGNQIVEYSRRKVGSMIS